MRNKSLFQGILVTSFIPKLSKSLSVVNALLLKIVSTGYPNYFTKNLNLQRSQWCLHQKLLKILNLQGISAKGLCKLLACQKSKMYKNPGWQWTNTETKRFIDNFHLKWALTCDTPRHRDMRKLLRPFNFNSLGSWIQFMSDPIYEVPILLPTQSLIAISVNLSNNFDFWIHRELQFRPDVSFCRENAITTLFHCL